MNNIFRWVSPPLSQHVYKYPLPLPYFKLNMYIPSKYSPLFDPISIGERTIAPRLPLR